LMEITGDASSVIGKIGFLVEGSGKVIFGETRGSVIGSTIAMEDGGEIDLGFCGIQISRWGEYSLW